MRRTCSALMLILAVSGLAAISTAGNAAAAIDECKLLTNAQARAIMGTKPVGGATPDNGGCSWQSDPYDRAHLAFVTLTVEPASKLLARYGDDLQTYLDESTNVGIDPLDGVGDEAFSTYSPLSGPGTADGISVRGGTRVVQLGFQPIASVKNPSPELDRVVRIVKQVVRKVGKS
jgi:hypothetical protein